MINLEFSNIQELIDVELYIKNIYTNIKEILLNSISFYYQVTSIDKFKEKYNLNIDIDISDNILKFKIDENVKEKLKIPFVVADFHTIQTGIYNEVKILCEIKSDIIYKKKIKLYDYNKIIHI